MAWVVRKVISQNEEVIAMFMDDENTTIETAKNSNREQ